MVKDVLNISRLGDNEQKLMEKVLSVDEYKPSKLDLLLGKIYKVFGIRFSLSVFCTFPCFINCVTIYHYNFTMSVLCSLIVFLLYYMLLKVFISEERLKMMWIMFKKWI
jgi:hypothetical protein